MRQFLTVLRKSTSMASHRLLKSIFFDNRKSIFAHTTPADIKNCACEYSNNYRLIVLLSCDNVYLV